MTNKQTSKKNTYNRLLVFFLVPAHAAIWAAFARLVNEIGNFTAINEDIEKFLAQQQQTSTGITSDKTNKYNTMVALTTKYARKARVWAADTNNATLEAIFDIHTSDFQLAEDVAESKIKDVRDALNTNIAALAPYNVTASHITDIDNSITAYHAATGTPGAAISQKKVGTEALVILFQMADKSLETITDLLVNEYSDDHLDLVKEFQNNCVVVPVGTHHQGIDAHITYTDGSGNAEGVTMTIVELHKSGESDILGMVETLRGKVGTYHVRFEGAGIVTKEIIAAIKQGEVLHLAVQVEKV